MKLRALQTTILIGINLSELVSQVFTLIIEHSVLIDSCFDCFRVLKSLSQGCPRIDIRFDHLGSCTRRDEGIHIHLIDKN